MIVKNCDDQKVVFESDLSLLLVNGNEIKTKIFFTIKHSKKLKLNIHNVSSHQNNKTFNVLYFG